jgi:hypothetical protein
MTVALVARRGVMAAYHDGRGAGRGVPLTVGQLSTRLLSIVEVGSVVWIVDPDLDNVTVSRRAADEELFNAQQDPFGGLIPAQVPAG